MKRVLNMVVPEPKPKHKSHWAYGLLDSMKDPNYIVEETPQVVVIKDKYPKAKYHYLVIPKEDISTIFKLTASHISLMEEFNVLYEKLKERHKNVKLRAGFHVHPSMHRLHMHVISTDMVSIWLKSRIHWNTFNTEFFIPYENIMLKLRNNEPIEEIGPEKHDELIQTPLKCNQCNCMPKNMPELKRHLLSHLPID